MVSGPYAVAVPVSVGLSEVAERKEESNVMNVHYPTTCHVTAEESNTAFSRPVAPSEYTDDKLHHQHHYQISFYFPFNKRVYGNGLQDRKRVLQKK